LIREPKSILYNGAEFYITVQSRVLLLRRVQHHRISSLCVPYADKVLASQAQIFIPLPGTVRFTDEHGFTSQHARLGADTAIWSDPKSNGSGIGIQDMPACLVSGMSIIEATTNGASKLGNLVKFR
jgi:hypothetical protein